MRKIKLLFAWGIVAYVIAVSGCWNQGNHINEDIKGIKGNNVDIRRKSAARLGRECLGTDNHALVGQAVSVLNGALSDKDVIVRRTAAEALGIIGEPSHPAVARLANMTLDDDENVRANAIGALYAIGDGAKPAVPQLLKAVKDKSWIIRSNAIRALARINLTNKEVLMAIAGTLQDDNETVRFESVEALGSAGAAAKEYIGTLSHVKEKDSSKEVRREAAYAIQQISGK